MVEVDYFNPVKDTFGRATGHVVRRQVARVIRGALRVGDFGGEEVMALLPRTGRSRVAAHAANEADIT
jgi:diguanylate cyclase (GGDEF)-like protein